TEVVLQQFRGELQMLDARGQGEGGQVGGYAGGGSSRGSDFGQSSPSEGFNRSGGGAKSGGGGGSSRELDDEIPF
ncbi:single-stranded DNA-binding protein, partial [Mesorhizobium sp. M7A.F.Ca.CA.002.15.2.1]